MDIYLILDESNTFYGAFNNPTHKKLEEAGVKIGYIDISKLKLDAHLMVIALISFIKELKDDRLI